MDPNLSLIFIIQINLNRNSLPIQTQSSQSMTRNSKNSTSISLLRTSLNLMISPSILLLTINFKGITLRISRNIQNSLKGTLLIPLLRKHNHSGTLRDSLKEITQESNNFIKEWSLTPWLILIRQRAQRLILITDLMEQRRDQFKAKCRESRLSIQTKHSQLSLNQSPSQRGLENQRLN